MFKPANATIESYKVLYIEATIKDFSTISPTFERLINYATANNVPVRATFLKYLDATQPKDMRAQFCIVVDGPAKEAGDIQYQELESYTGKFITASNIPFADLPGTYAKMAHFIQDNNLTISPTAMYELYNEGQTAHILWPVE